MQRLNIFKLLPWKKTTRDTADAHSVDAPVLPPEQTTPSSDRVATDELMKGREGDDPLERAARLAGSEH